MEIQEKEGSLSNPEDLNDFATIQIIYLLPVVHNAGELEHSNLV
jgi:hypothetical protein